MKAIEFPEVTHRIGEKQEEYQTLPVHAGWDKQTGLSKITMCFELDEKEKKQVLETGQIWLSVLQSPTAIFHPISPDVLKPESLEE